MRKPKVLLGSALVQLGSDAFSCGKMYILLVALSLSPFKVDMLQLRREGEGEEEKEKDAEEEKAEEEDARHGE